MEIRESGGARQTVNGSHGECHRQGGGQEEGERRPAENRPLCADQDTASAEERISITRSASLPASSAKWLNFIV